MPAEAFRRWEPEVSLKPGQHHPIFPCWPLTSLLRLLPGLLLWWLLLYPTVESGSLAVLLALQRDEDAMPGRGCLGDPVYREDVL